MKRLFKSFGFAINGLATVWREQPNFRIHIVVFLVVLCAAWLANLNLTEWAIVLLCAGMVLAAELFNSVIEKIVDWVNPQWSEQAGKIKDMAAAAVLVASITSALVGIIIFSKKLLLF